MKRVDIKLGFQCNNHCRFCVQGDKREKFPDKTDREVRDILEKEAKECQEVLFSGGEPTFRPNELLDWVRYAKELKYQIIQIQTNGRMFAYMNYCEEIIKAGANVFGLSIHGSNPQIHDYLTRVPGSWGQTTRGIKNLKSLGRSVMTNSVVNKINYKDLPDLAKLLVSLGVRQFQFAFMHINRLIASDPKLIKEIVPRHPAVEPYVKKGLQIGIKAGLRVMTEAIPYCFMKGYEQYIAEKIIPDAAVYDADSVIKDFTPHRKTKGKAKGPNCKKCRYYKVCEGPWKEYPEIFGWKEFKPVKD